MARVRPVRGRMGVWSGPRRVPFGGGGRPGPFGGGYGVHTVISESGGEYRVRLFIDGEYQAGADYFTDDVVEANETAKAMEEDAYLSDKSSDVARGEAEDFVEDAIDRPHVGEEFSALPSADRAMLTHAASGEPPRLGRANPERSSGSAPYEPVPELPPEQMERNREGVRKARETLGSSPVGGQHSMEQTFAPAIEQSRQSLGLSTTDQMLLMAALAAVTGGGSAALRAAPLVGRGALASVAGLGALIGGASPAHAASGPTVRELSPEQAAQLQKAGSVVDQAAGAGGGDRGWRGMAADAAMAVPFTRGPASAGVALRNLLPPAGRVVRDAGITAAMLSPAIAELTGHPIPSFGNNVLNSPDQKALIRLAADRAAGRGRTRGQR